MFNRRLSRWLFVILWLCAAHPALARDKNVTVYEVQDGDAINIIGKLDRCTEATITITASLENMTSSLPLPLTVDITGSHPTLLVSFKPRDTNNPWTYSWSSYWKHGHRHAGTPSAYVYSLPFKSSIYEVIQGPYGTFSHYAGSQDEEAIDWKMSVGTTVYAARPGTVMALRSDCSSGAPDTRLISEYNYVMIKHDDGTYAEYVHLEKDGVLVHLGERVALGQPIALSGNTGYTSTPHLHFAVFYPLDGYTRKTLPVTF